MDIKTIIKKFKIVLYFFFWENGFIKLEIERISRSNVSQIENTVRELRTAIFRSFLTSFIILALSTIISYWIFPKYWSLKPSKCLGILSTFCILWATYGQLGWEIETWTGETYVEAVNRYWFRGVFGLGMFLLFFAIFIG